MDTINSLIGAFLILIPLCASTRILVCCLKMMFNDTETEQYRKRILNCIKVIIISISVYSIKAVVEYYFLGRLS